MIHGDLPSQHSFGTTLRCNGPVPEDSLQYVCMVIIYSRVWIIRVRLPTLLVVSGTGKNEYSPVPVRD